MHAPESPSPNTEPSDCHDRHYRVPRIGPWFGRGFVLFAALFEGLILLGNHSDIPSLAIGIPSGACLVAITVWIERLWPRAGLHETPAGLRVVNGFGSRTIPWEVVERFESSQTRPRSRVLLVSTSGAVMPLVGTAQGSRITWDGGETHDIVAELNQRLVDCHAPNRRSRSQAAAPTALG